MYSFIHSVNTKHRISGYRSYFIWSHIET